MKTFAESGGVLEFTAPSGGVVSGSAYKIGSLVVVATETVAQTLPFIGVPMGVVDLPKVAEEGWTEGLKLYWDTSPAGLTKEASGNTLIGVAIQPVAAVVSLATDALAADLAIVGMTLQVLDFTQLGTDDATVTVTINGVATVLTEGTDWTASVSDDSTATSLAAAIDALTGVTAAAVTDTVTVVPATGVSAVNLTTGRVRLDGAAR
jgi:predicted RecA/RadA family phage recombinase